MTHTSSDAMTYVPREAEAEALSALLARLAPVGGEGGAALVDANDTRIELPHDVFEALLAVVRALAQGEGISVIPRNQLLTTQESADMLGISRPTLVRLLESGIIPFARHGRHRRVRLADLIDYQASARKGRADALDRLAQVGEEIDAYSATDGPPPSTR